jgi:hypothetical protein
MDTRSSVDDRDIVQLREEFTGHRIWRSTRSMGILIGAWPRCVIRRLELILW